jgi:hypothetical protein
VQGAGRGDDQAVEIKVQQTFESWRHGGVWSQPQRLGGHLHRRIGDANRIDGIGGQDRLHAIPPDPAHPEEADARARVTS